MANEDRVFTKSELERAHVEYEEALKLGAIAYNAYCTTSQWRSLVSGEKLPTFGEQRDNIKLAWINAAIAVRDHVNRAVS